MDVWNIYRIHLPYFTPDVGNYELIDHPLKWFKVGRNIKATFFRHLVIQFILCTINYCKSAIFPWESYERLTCCIEVLRLPSYPRHGPGGGYPWRRAYPGAENSLGPDNKTASFSTCKAQRFYIPPGKLTWNLKIICLKRKIIFQTSIFGFHVTYNKNFGWWFQTFFIFTPNLGEKFQFDSYFSDGLKPPTRKALLPNHPCAGAKCCC